jgi:adenylosuccinate lyase
MIPRYSRPEMVAVWSPESKFRIWFEIEAHACDALAEARRHSERARRRPSGKRAVQAPPSTSTRIDEIEARNQARRHRLPYTPGRDSSAPTARFVHQGMTSSDVLDTTLQRPAGSRPADLLLADMDASCSPRIKRRAIEHKDTDLHRPQRTASTPNPMTFGLTLAEASMPSSTAAGTRLVNARAEIATCAISGAVGTFANIDPRVEEHVCERPWG